MNWKLSPSDLTFLYEECPRCFYLKVHGLLPRPRTPMPKIFTAIDSAMKAYLHGQRSDGLAAGIPRGIFDYSEKWVESVPFAIPGCMSTCYFRGRFDVMMKLDNGGRCLPDLKTCHRRDEHIGLYGRQLHSYTWCVENSAPGALCLRPIERMGLLVFEPDTFFKGVWLSGALLGRLHWIEVQRDDEAFLRFLAEVVCLLDSPTAPDPAPDCAWCRYRLTNTLGSNLPWTA
jgi:hypothetical protein